MCELTQRKNEKDLWNLLKNSLGFHFSLINIIPMIALAVKERKGERKPVNSGVRNLPQEHTQGSFLLTHNRHCTEGHNQRQGSKGIGGEHSQLPQQQQQEPTPPGLGSEVGPGVLGACQPDVAVFLGKSTETKQCCHV